MDWKAKAILATKGSQFGAIVACALGEKIDPPHFVGRASVTSDGFVMCDYVDRHGWKRMGAFAGTYGDLINNTRGLERHLGLSGVDLSEYRSTMNAWIARNYSDEGT